MPQLKLVFKSSWGGYVTVSYKHEIECSKIYFIGIRGMGRVATTNLRIGKIKDHFPACGHPVSQIKKQ